MKPSEAAKIYRELVNSNLYSTLPAVGAMSEQDKNLSRQIEALMDRQLFLQVEPLVTQIASGWEEVGFFIGLHLAELYRSEEDSV